MQKYVEIKRDGLTLRGMLHIPKDVSQKVPMVILLHGFVMIEMKLILYIMNCL